MAGFLYTWVVALTLGGSLYTSPALAAKRYTVKQNLMPNHASSSIGTEVMPTWSHGGSLVSRLPPEPAQLS